MRLIDADELIQLLCANMDTGPQFTLATMCVDAMPAVDAIPVSVIHREIDNWDRKKPQSAHAICYRHLIEDWRRENEAFRNKGNEPEGNKKAA